MIEKFIKIFEPDNNLIKPSKKIIDLYKDKLPKEIIDLWKYGFGNYGYGIIKVIDPSKYIVYLKLKIGIDSDAIPFLIDAFGNIFYYLDNNVYVFNTEFNFIDVCASSFDDFMNNRIVSDEFISMFLKKDVFNDLLTRNKIISNDEIYIYNPPLFIGGPQITSNIIIKNVFKYYDFIFPFLLSMVLEDEV